MSIIIGTEIIEFFFSNIDLQLNSCLPDSWKDGFIYNSGHVHFAIPLFILNNLRNDNSEGKVVEIILKFNK